MKNEMTKIIKRNLVERSIKKVWGGSKLLVEYDIQTSSLFGAHQMENKYLVVCEIAGLDDGLAELRIIKVTARTNNEETLTADALADALKWECGSGVETEMPEENEVA